MTTPTLMFIVDKARRLGWLFRPNLQTAATPQPRIVQLLPLAQARQVELRERMTRRN